jgi:hypothetical protein
MNNNRFNIDFFEFIFLVEACIPPVPIARSCFWEKVINIHYHELNENERKKLFEIITNNQNFTNKDEDCRLFFARYNPENQYMVDTEFEGKKEQHECFRFNDKFHLTKSKFIDPNYIVSSKKIKN